MAVRIVSYNLLVPIYADQPEYYHKCYREHLQTNYRLKLIESQLEREIANHSHVIFCFQELCQTFVQLLQPFLERHNYRLFSRLYGQAHNDYMGVGIALPKSINVQSNQSLVVGEYVRPLPKAAEPTGNFFALIRSFFKRTDPRSQDFPRFDRDPLRMARSIANQLLCVNIEIDGRALSIGTYHMPCMYKYPDVMVMHATTVKYLMTKLAHDRPWILAGDFNFTPTDPCYSIIRRDHVFSAYEKHYGREPHYTNFATTAPDGRYCATLDYIFYTGQKLQVENALPLPKQPTGDSYPDQNNPSDHLMIAATFRLL